MKSLRLLPLVLLAACSSSNGDSLPVADAGKDTAVAVDTDTPIDANDTGGPKPVDGGPKDTGFDAGPTYCDQDLPGDFACAAPTKIPTAGTVCTEAQLEAFVTKCIADPVTSIPPGCTDWKTANAACSACITGFAIDTVSSKNLPDRDKCYWTIFDDKCDKAVNCSFECQRAVCEACSTDPGTGLDGKRSEFQDCLTRAQFAGTASKPKGRCYDIASKEAKACFTTFDIVPCIVDELYTPSGAGGKPDVTLLQNQIVQYLRGACRDGGSWAKYTMP